MAVGESKILRRKGQRGLEAKSPLRSSNRAPSGGWRSEAAQKAGVLE